MSRDVNVLRLVRETPWAIMPESLRTISEVVHLHASGGHFTVEEVRARLDAAAKDQGPRAARGGGLGGKAVAVLPLYGVISQRANLLTEFSGGTSTEGFAKAFRAALNDPQVGAIVIDVDSPGGSVFGVAELADEIRSSRGTKKITAVANSLAASAAYWIASAADEVVVTPGGMVGSVGVIVEHTDVSKAEEQAGVKTTAITYGRFKAEGSPYEPLSDEARAALQETVNAYGAKFVAAVAKGRGVSVKDVQANYGEGRVLTADAALAAGMVDRIATLDQVLAKMGATTTRGPGAEDDHEAVRAARARDIEIAAL